jgi:hypothetical protein
MPAQEVNQPQVQQMDVPKADDAQQPVRVPSLALAPIYSGVIVETSNITNVLTEAC